MDNYLKLRDISKTLKKKYKYSKPYWDKQLTFVGKPMAQFKENFRNFITHINIKHYVICLGTDKKFIKLK